MKCRNDCATGADLNAFLLNNQQLHGAPTSGRKLRGSNAQVDLTSLTVLGLHVQFQSGRAADGPYRTRIVVEAHAGILKGKLAILEQTADLPFGFLYQLLIGFLCLMCALTLGRTFEGDSEDDAAGDAPALRLFPTIVDTRMPPPKATAIIVPVYFRK
jgi:hypothetical protein